MSPLGASPFLVMGVGVTSRFSLGQGIEYGEIESAPLLPGGRRGVLYSIFSDSVIIC